MSVSEDFWGVVDGSQQDTVRKADALFSELDNCGKYILRRALLQYRFFTIYYISDLAYLVAKLPFGKLRSFMAQILDEELGSGDAQRAHPELYDSFLRSLGISDDLLQQGLVSNLVLLDNNREQLINNAHPYGIGLRGMGGECLCQIYLENLHRHIIKNPYVRQNQKTIDWKFWDIHVGPVDVHHREETRARLDELLKQNPEFCEQILAGYLSSIQSWDLFWKNAMTEAISHKEVEKA